MNFKIGQIGGGEVFGKVWSEERKGGNRTIVLYIIYREKLNFKKRLDPWRGIWVTNGFLKRTVRPDFSSFSFPSES